MTRDRSHSLLAFSKPSVMTANTTWSGREDFLHARQPLAEGMVRSMASSSARPARHEAVHGHVLDRKEVADHVELIVELGDRHAALTRQRPLVGGGLGQYHLPCRS